MTSRGYIENMENTTTHNAVTITKIKSPKVQRVVALRYIPSERFNYTGEGEYVLGSIAKAQAFVDRCIQAGATVDNGILVGTMETFDYGMFGGN